MTKRNSVPKSWLRFLTLVDLDGIRPPAIPSRGTTQVPARVAAFSRAPSAMQSVALLKWAVTRWPWAAPCLVISPGHEELADALPMVVGFAYRLALLPLSPDASLPPLRGIRALFLARPSPPPSDLAGYVAASLSVTELEVPLRDQFASSPRRSPLPRSPATYSRLFAKYGSFDARDWRHVALLVRWFVAGPGADVLTPVTEGRLCRHYLSMPPGAVRQRFFAWEHVVEAALSGHGYLPRSSTN